MPSEISTECDRERCPLCAEPMTRVTVLGPDRAIVAPCGHVVDPRVFEYE